MSPKTYLPLLLLILTLLLAACGGTTAEAPPPAPTDTSEPPPAPTNTPVPAPTDTPLPTPTDTPESPPPTDTPAPVPTDTPPPASTEATAAVPTPTPESASATQLDTGELVSAGWQVEDIDDGIKPALALDSQGRPHVTYMLEAEEGYVKYALRAAEGWALSTVAEGYFYGPPDIAVDGDDTPHIVWHDHQDLTFQPDKGDAVQAQLRSGGTWDITTIRHPGHDGWDNSVVVDSQGNVHTASIDPSQFGSQDGVEYAASINDWQVERIGSGPIAYEFGTAIAVDNQDQPGISYYDDQRSTLRYAHRSPDGTWTVETVDNNGSTGKYSSLDFDAEGHPHISYFVEESSSSGTIRYAFWDGSSWQIQDVDTVTNVKQGFVGARHLTWLRLDTQGQPHIAYNDQSQLKYALNNGDSWQIEVVAEAGDDPFGQLVQLDLDAQDKPHLVYSIFTNPSIPQGVIKYASRTE